MKEHPLLFSAPMVRAILDGRKTQTRRIVKNATGAFFDHSAYEPVEIRHREWAFRDKSAKSLLTAAEGSPVFRCPYGTAGDRLWVKETHRHHLCAGADMEQLHFAADGPCCPVDGERIKPWRPSIFMRRVDSRITLEIVAVRVERLQSITEEDALAEGIIRNPNLDGYCYDDEGRGFHGSRAVRAYENLWRSINGPDSWGRNPWVWVLDFKKTTK
jgi:hypothetical protein